MFINNAFFHQILPQKILKLNEKNAKFLLIFKMCYFSIKLYPVDTPTNENVESDAVGFNFGYTVFECKICSIEFKSEEARNR